MVPSWDRVPGDMRSDAVRSYYEILRRKKASLIAKRIFDVVVSALMIVILSPVMLVLAVMIKADSRGPVLYRQERVTQYGRVFRVFKFRTMVENADQIGAHVTADKDPRITGMGSRIRDLRLDELPQLFNVFAGSMSFVGTRPEALRYVRAYTDEMKATLLLPAGVTSEASIEFKDEAELLEGAADIEKKYVEEVLPRKMAYNLRYLERMSFFGDMALMFRTVVRVLHQRRRD